MVNAAVNARYALKVAKTQLESLHLCTWFNQRRKGVGFFVMGVQALMLNMPTNFTVIVHTDPLEVWWQRLPRVEPLRCLEASTVDGDVLKSSSSRSHVVPLL
jgi:hypothetical protein